MFVVKSLPDSMSDGFQEVGSISGRSKLILLVADMVVHFQVLGDPQRSSDSKSLEYFNTFHSIPAVFNKAVTRLFQIFPKFLLLRVLFPGCSGHFPASTIYSSVYLVLFKVKILIYIPCGPLQELNLLSSIINSPCLLLPDSFFWRGLSEQLASVNPRRYYVFRSRGEFLFCAHIPLVHSVKNQSLAQLPEAHLAHPFMDILLFFHCQCATFTDYIVYCLIFLSTQFYCFSRF